MKIKTIKLRVNLNIKYLIKHLYTFFKNTNFKSQYIYVLTKVTTEEGKNEYSLGSRILLDVKNKIEIKTYLDIVTKNYLKHGNKHKAIPNDTLTIHHVETDKESYIKYVKDISVF